MSGLRAALAAEMGLGAWTGTLAWATALLRRWQRQLARRERELAERAAGPGEGGGR